MKPKTRQTILIILMVFVCLLVLKRYLPMIQLPTAGRVEQKQRELKSLQNDLLVARKTYQERLASIQSMQTLAEPFWIPSSAAAKVDQEVSAEFNRITRLSQLSTATGTQKVDVNKEKNGSCLQEVVLSADFKNVSMHDLSRFFSQMRSSAMGRKFRWDYCKISPDNAKSPTSVNMSARFKVLVLNNDAMAFLGLNKGAPAPAADTQKASRGNTPATPKK